jgi:hypothetical protein
MKITTETEYKLEQRVYLVNDPEQDPRTVIAIIIFPGAVMYRLSGVQEEDDYYGFEVTAKKNILIGSEKDE